MSSSSSLFALVIITAITLKTLVLAAPQFVPQRVYPNELPTPYEYHYKVENPPTNTYYGKNEAGDAAGKVTGSYYVYLPDGRLMTIDYLVDGQSGFVPRITYANQAYPGIQG